MLIISQKRPHRGLMILFGLLVLLGASVFLTAIIDDGPTPKK